MIMAVPSISGVLVCRMGELLLASTDAGLYTDEQLLSDIGQLGLKLDIGNWIFGVLRPSAGIKRLRR